MHLFTRLVRFTRRFCRRKARHSADLSLLEPLNRLVGGAEPDPDLFDDIERRLERRAGAPRRPPSGWRGVIIGVLLGAAGVGGTAMVRNPADTGPLAISVRPDPGADWLPLGHVTMDGTPLSAFVAAKCTGHTHLSITLGGHDATAQPLNPAGPDRAVMAAGEKILMECIF